MNTSKRLQCILSSVLLLWLTACHDGSSGSNKSPTQTAAPEPVQPTYNFTEVDAGLENFVAGHEVFNGASIMLEHKNWGGIHEAAFGDHTLDTVAGVASMSKTAVASVLMAMASDPELDFDVDTPLENIYPVMGVYPGLTTAHLLTNTSGIPSFFDFITNPREYGVHNCQNTYNLPNFPASDSLLECAQGIYGSLLPGTVAPGTQFIYGFSQWQLAGGVAEIVGGATWAQLVDQYISQPCGMEVLKFGNMRITEWDGTVEGLVGEPNPSLHQLAIATVKDILRLATLQLHDGACGDTQVLSESAVQRMREDVGSALGSQEDGSFPGFGNGMGWWMRPTTDGSAPTFFRSIGAYASIIWFDTEREYAGAIMMADYTRLNTVEAITMVNEELIPMIEDIIDGAQ
jgi:CubicO group peptidase (beta-lactamase class C family)